MTREPTEDGPEARPPEDAEDEPPSDGPEGNPGLPPEGDDPMDGAAPSG
ncbi:MAG TPA: hypothetical protein VGO60_07320 [Iamia sp.]|jgi:hypothetical protein|nr:hypothetical protein [Iamia sp.]